MANRLVKFDFDPLEDLDVTLKPSDKKELLGLIADYVHESILSDVGDSVSPVTGREFKKLSKQYAEREHDGDRTSHLELEGDLLDSIKVTPIGSKIRATVDESEQPKADGHNNFTGKSKLPRRPFIPDEKRGEDFRSSIKKGIKEIIDDFLLGLE